MKVQVTRSAELRMVTNLETRTHALEVQMGGETFTIWLDRGQVEELQGQCARALDVVFRVQPPKIPEAREAKA